MSTQQKTLKLLVVEDNPAYMMLVKEILGKFDDFDVHLIKEFASTGKEALEKFPAFQPDVTLLDINLPDSSGLDLLKAFLEFNPSSFISMMTSESQASFVKEASARGAQGYVLKPFTAAKIKNVFHQYYKHPASKTKGRFNSQSETANNLLQGINGKSPIAGLAPKSPDEVFKGWRILVADGDLGRQTQLQSVLNGLGCKVTVNSNGEQAWDSIKNGHFDVVLMDMALPVIDGYQVANQLRLMDEKKPTKTHTIALFANQNHVNEARLEFVGVSKYLLKPLSAEKLRKYLSEHAKICLENWDEQYV